MNESPERNVSPRSSMDSRRGDVGCDPEHDGGCDAFVDVDADAEATKAGAEGDGDSGGRAAERSIPWDGIERPSRSSMRARSLALLEVRLRGRRGGGVPLVPIKSTIQAVWLRGEGKE